MRTRQDGVTYRRRGSKGTLTLCGMVDIFEASALLETARKAHLDEQARTLLLDLQYAERLDTSALQILIALRRDVQSANRTWSVVNVPERLQTALAKMGVTL